METHNGICRKNSENLEVGELYFFHRSGDRYLCLCLSEVESKIGLVHGVLKVNDDPRFDIDTDPNQKIYSFGLDWTFFVDPNASIIEHQINGLVVDEGGMYIRFADDLPQNRRHGSLKVGGDVEVLLSPISAKDAISSWCIMIDQEEGGGCFNQTVFSYSPNSS